MSNRMFEKGFGIVEVVLVIAVLVILGGVGWVAYNNFMAPKSNDSSKTDTASHDEMDMPKIESSADLEKASTSLDDASFEDDGTKEFESQTAQF